MSRCCLIRFKTVFCLYLVTLLTADDTLLLFLHHYQQLTTQMKLLSPHHILGNLLCNTNTEYACEHFSMVQNVKYHLAQNNLNHPLLKLLVEDIWYEHLPHLKSLLYLYVFVLILWKRLVCCQTSRGSLVRGILNIQESSRLYNCKPRSVSLFLLSLIHI